MMYDFFAAIDPFLLWAFSLPGNVYAGLVLGYLWLCLVATVIGELAMAGAYFINKGHFRKIHLDMVDHNNLSIEAIRAGDKASYKAANSIANDAFGKNFFSHIALFAASVWPAFLAMGWLDFRFRTVAFDLPLLGEVGTAFFFVPSYILVRVAFNLAGPWIPGFCTIKRKVRENEDIREMKTFMDLMKVPDKDTKGGKDGAAA